ncbi:excalibur calcium-binding domain-containing protein [Pseudomonas sp. NPDC087358]|uniref:excalibur calcium-binding domain-containing protein n=1 Tax=Pseudomonas sp. NPDC087358 TaxID=3364439 RepID=UPI00384A9B36
MKRIFWAVLIAGVVFVLVTSPVIQRWAGIYITQLRGSSTVTVASADSAKLASTPIRCDGRKYCSQMTSCAEATAFLQQCPGMEMDGDGDGIPCESQWCKR